jgi:phage terminase small subunit
VARQLLAREKLFIFEYLLDFDEARAAQEAGYPSPSEGRRLLRKRAVAEEIRQAKERQAERYRISPERICEELAKVAFADAKDFYPTLGQTLDLGRLDSNRSRAISEFTIDEQEDLNSGQIYRRTKVRLHDKIAALRDLARIAGLLREEHVLTLEAKIKQMTPQERVNMANELIERGKLYLPQYLEAVRRGEIIEPEGLGEEDADAAEGEAAASAAAAAVPRQRRERPPK